MPCWSWVSTVWNLSFKRWRDDLRKRMVVWGARPATEAIGRPKKARNNNLINLFLRMDGIVPLAVKSCRDDLDARKLFVAHHDSGFVVAGVQGRLHHQPCFRGRMGDEIDDYLVTGQWSATPVLGNKAKEAVFDFVPFAGARWEVANLQPQAQIVSQPLQGNLPQPVAAAVTAAAVGRDHQLCRPRKPPRPHFLPPPPNAGCGELRRVMIDPHAHPALVARQIVNPVRNRFSQLLFGKVMHLHFHRLALRLPLLTRILEFAHQFLLFGVDGHYGLALPLKR